MKLWLEVFAFLRARKKIWLYPVVALVGMFGTLMVVGEGSVLSPILYAIF